MNRENLWAPWRMAYIRELERKQAAAAAAPATSRNFLREYWENPGADTRNHVVARGAHGMVLLNRYPYANGHLLVALGEARPRLLDYSSAQRAEFWRLVDYASDLMVHALRPQGLNIGINEGTAAGAGLPEHIHAHIVPRWNGDTNFLSVVGDVRVVPDSLDVMAATYREVATALPSL